MHSENQSKICYADDNEYTNYSDICYELARIRYYNNHLNSQTHVNNFYKRQRSINTNTNSSST